MRAFQALAGQVAKSAAALERAVAAVAAAQLVADPWAAPAGASKAAAAAAGGAGAGDAAGAADGGSGSGGASAGGMDDSGSAGGGSGGGGGSGSSDGGVPELRDFYDRAEAARAAAVEAAVRRYRGMTPVMLKVTQGVVG